MACELEPLSWKEFQARYQSAWNNGWVFGTAFTELYLDYLDGWRWFIKHLDVVINHFNNDNEMSIKILIGEAPPIWRGTNLTKERTYFYNADHVKGNQPWLNEPFKYFNQKDFSTNWDKGKYTGPNITKQEKLDYLASKGIILIDVFPFPIIQDTNNRKKVSLKPTNTKFSRHVHNYLIKQLEKLKEHLNCKIKDELNFECAFIAPEYTSLQLMYDPNIQNEFKKLQFNPLAGFNIVKISETKFDEKLGNGVIPIENEPSKSKEMSYFLYKLNLGKVKIEENELEDIPILISNRTPNFENFFNSSEQIMKEKFSKKSKKE